MVIKTLLFCCIFFLLLILPSNVSPWANQFNIGYSQSIHSVSINSKERAWLKKHRTLRVAFDGYNPPFSYLDKSGQITGIAFDTVKLIAHKLNIQITVDKRKHWKSIYQAARKKRVDVVAAMVNKPTQKQPFLFTQPYARNPLVIATHVNNKEVKNAETLSGKTVALVKINQLTPYIVDDLPGIIPLYVKNISDALEAVKNQQADGAIGPFINNHALQTKNFQNKIKLVDFYDRIDISESIGIRNDWSILTGLFQKGLDSFSEAEKRKINRHSYSPTTKQNDYQLIQTIITVFITILFALLIWVLEIKQLDQYKRKKAKANAKQDKAIDSRNKKKIAKNLINGEQKYRSLVENLKSKYFFYQRDTSGVYTYLSPSITSILGYSIEEFSNHYSTFQTDHPDNANISAYTKRCLRGEKVPPYEVEVYDSDSHKRFLEILEIPLYNEQRECIGLEGIAQDITPLKKTQEQLNWLSYYDDLTGLANRRLFKKRVEQSIALSQRRNDSMAIFFMDIDRFKIVNDSLGHAAGDDVLKETAARLESQLRDSDFAARMGGDEFTVILPSCDRESAQIVAVKILHSLLAPYELKDHQFTLGASIGISLYPKDGENSKVLLQQADSAMYHAKKEKSGYAFCSSDLNEKNNRRLVLEQALRKALEQERYDNDFELKVFYQNKHSIKHNELLGFEALIRWDHPDLGKVSPVEFIPIAEETGLIAELSRWIITRVCMQTTYWAQNGVDFGKIAINISAVELINFELAKNIIGQIDATGAKRSWIEIEITETALMKMPDVAIEVIQQLVDAGVLIAIDDFGTGYSSLAYLKNIPASYIKIDQSFIENVISSREDQAVVNAIIAMSHALGKKVIAEGVETQEQLTLLSDSGCDIAQGYLFSKPVAAKNIDFGIKREIITERGTLVKEGGVLLGVME